MEIRFRIAGRLSGKASPRMTKQGHAYTPRQTVVAESIVRSAFQDEAPEGWKAWEGPVRMQVDVSLRVPKSWPRWKREAALLMPAYACRRPDVDNVVKLICDALNGVAYVDDRQVAEVSVGRYWDEQDEVSVALRFWPVLARETGG